MNKRKRSIAEHSLALFLEKGVQNTSVQDIIDRAGISKGTFYNHFSSKTDCINAILEQIRHEAELSRSKMLSGRDAKDPDLLAEQIAVLSALREKRGINAILEEILHSGDEELKRLVLRHRILELEWLAERLAEVYGEELRPHAFEGAVLAYGMLHHLLFFLKMTGLRERDFKRAASAVLHYMGFVAQALIRHGTDVLDTDLLPTLNLHLNREPVMKADIVMMLDKLLRERAQESPLSGPQADLARALLAELEREQPGEAVIRALLGPFTEAFADSPLAAEAGHISAALWRYVRRRT